LPATDSEKEDRPTCWRIIAYSKALLAVTLI
jgi:hypothetical protein